jgi:hypothetical protein
LEAAELVAFDVLEPALRSRGAITDRAKQLYADSEFREKVRQIFSGDPSGRLVIPTMQQALQKLDDFEKRLMAVEKRLKTVETRLDHERE